MEIWRDDGVYAQSFIRWEHPLKICLLPFRPRRGETILSMSGLVVSFSESFVCCDSASRSNPDVFSSFLQLILGVLTKLKGDLVK